MLQPICPPVHWVEVHTNAAALMEPWYCFSQKPDPDLSSLPVILMKKTFRLARFRNMMIEYKFIFGLDQYKNENHQATY